MSPGRSSLPPSRIRLWLPPPLPVVFIPSLRPKSEPRKSPPSTPPPAHRRDEGSGQGVRHGRLEQPRRLDRSDLAAPQARERAPSRVLADGFRPRQILRGTLRYVPVVALHSAVFGGDHRARNRVPRGGKTFQEAVAVGEGEVPLLAGDAGAFGVHDALVQAERGGLASLRDLDRTLDGQIPGMEEGEVLRIARELLPVGEPCCLVLGR